jgi:Tfp pilus assembly protein PilO
MEQEVSKALERSALNPLWETSGLFVLMAIIICILGYAFWKTLMKYLKKLEEESEQTKVLEDIKNELTQIKNELIRGTR